MTRPIPPSLQRLVGRYVSAFAPEQIVLFGSYAKGTEELRSDVDLLIVAELAGDATAHLRRARQHAQGCFPRVDVVIASPDEVEGSSVARSPFLRSIVESGVVLYERSHAPRFSGMS